MPVTVYTRNNCAACNGTKAWLEQHGVDFETINVQDEGNEVIAQWLVDAGWRAMPVVMADNGSWSGTNIEKMKELVNDG